MAKITRKLAKIFGSNAGFQQVAQYGSLAAGSPVYSTDPETIQNLANWLTGWFGAVLGSNSPAIEDMNGFCYVMAYQIAYLMQTGVPEWNTDTTYYIGSMVTANSQIYVSLVDTNAGNAVTDGTKWRQLTNNSGKPKSITFADSPYTATAAEPVLAVDTSGGNVVVNLPTLATGFLVEVTKTTSDANTVTVTPNGAEKINDASTDVLEYKYANKSYRPLSIGWVIK